MCCMTPAAEGHRVFVTEEQSRLLDLLAALQYSEGSLCVAISSQPLATLAVRSVPSQDVVSVTARVLWDGSGQTTSADVGPHTSEKKKKNVRKRASRQIAPQVTIDMQTASAWAQCYGVAQKYAAPSVSDSLIMHRAANYTTIHRQSPSGGAHPQGRRKYVCLFPALPAHKESSVRHHCVSEAATAGC
jgi:hypothetical protein